MIVKDNEYVYDLVDYDNGISVKTFIRMVKNIDISYDGTNLQIVTNDDPYTGELKFLINGVSTTINMQNGLGTIPYTLTGYDDFTASLDGYVDGHLVIGQPPAPPDRVSELETKVAQLQAQNDQLVLMVGDLALGGL